MKRLNFQDACLLLEILNIYLCPQLISLFLADSLNATDSVSGELWGNWEHYGKKKAQVLASYFILPHSFWGFRIFNSWSTIFLRKFIK